MFRVVRFAQPEQRKFWNPIFPERSCENTRCPRVALLRFIRRRKRAEHFYDRIDPVVQNRFARKNILAVAGATVSIKQEANSFCSRDGRFAAVLLDYLGKSR